jgi:hypothetical protein
MVEYMIKEGSGLMSKIKRESVSSWFLSHAFGWLCLGLLTPITYILIDRPITMATANTPKVCGY